MTNDMADGKITIYGELESGVPNGKIVDYSLVANTPEIYTKQEIDEKFENTSGGGGGAPSGDLSEYAKIAYVDDEVQKAKDYTDEKFNSIDVPELPKLAKVAETGDYNDLENKPTIPSIDGLASTTEVQQALNSANSYTDGKVNDIYIPTLLSELSDDENHRLVTDDDKQSWNSKSDFSGDYNDLENLPTIPDVSGFATKESLSAKQDKTAIVTATDSVTAGNRSVIDVTGDVVISLVPYEDDGYTHSYEIVLNVGDTAYSVAFPESVKWVKNLEIAPNARHYIIIEDNTAMWTAVTK